MKLIVKKNIYGCKTHSEAYEKALKHIPDRKGGYYYTFEDLKSTITQSVLFGSEPEIIIYEAIYSAHKPRKYNQVNASERFTDVFEDNEQYRNSLTKSFGI